MQLFMHIQKPLKPLWLNGFRFSREKSCIKNQKNMHKNMQRFNASKFNVYGLMNTIPHWTIKNAYKAITGVLRLCIIL